MMAEGHREAARSVIDRAEHGGMRCRQVGMRGGRGRTEKDRCFVQRPFMLTG
jgi:hypothetical protein